MTTVLQRSPQDTRRHVGTVEGADLGTKHLSAVLLYHDVDRANTNLNARKRLMGEQPYRG